MSNPMRDPAPDERRSNIGVLLGVVGLGSYLWWLVTVVSSPSVWGWDFRAYYAATHALLEGANLYELGSPTTPFYLYPPALAFLMLPLGALSLPAATLVWNVLQHLCLLGASALVVWLTRNDLAAWPTALRVGLLLFLWGIGVPLRDEIYLGQVNGLILLLLLGALALTRPWEARETTSAARLVTAGLLLGLAISIKVQPILLLPYFLLRGKWRLAIAGGAGFVLLQAATIPFTNSTLDYWLNLFPDLLRRSQAYIDNQSINGLASRWLLPNEVVNLPRIDNYESVWRIISTGANLLVLLGAGIILVWPRIAAWRSKRSAVGLPAPMGANRLLMLLEIALILASVSLTSYVTWPHHGVWWVVAALALAGWWLLMEKSVPAWGMGALGLVAVILSHSPGDWLRLADARQHPYLAALLSGMHLYAMALLWVILAVTLMRSRFHRVGTSSVKGAT